MDAVSVPDAGARSWWGRVFRWERRRLGDPPKRVFVGCLVTVSLVCAWTSSWPNGSLFWFLAEAFAWFVLGVVWAFLFGAAVLTRSGRARLRAARWRWAAVPVAVVLVLAGLRAGLPLQARFAASEDALRATAVEAARGGEPQLGWRGLYRVTAAEPLAAGRGALLSVPGGSGVFRIDGGFAYAPDGSPAADRGRVSFIHLTGDWYTWYESW
ncbi:hypothetical protein LZ495_09530 [Yinghuangia sp. KLBMP8922]|uniref:DUF1109 domain-containing protein n=1 Tax=Yinghuangia soli TaxID=2908204 RepID=A0AA41PXZ2_9ACTN|nr:hypothetical protein [Yinghuangia soli]